MMRLDIAVSSGDILQCRQLVAEVYNKSYGVVFSRDTYDLDRKIEPWPHRFIMGRIGDELAAVCGLYLHNTYVERFGLVSDEEVEAKLREAGMSGQYDASARREITKLVVAPRWRRSGLGALIIAIALARSFADMDAERPQLVTLCAVRSMLPLVERHGVRPRYLKAFPYYKIHEQYRSESNPMDSYLVIPELDVPRRFRELRIPGDHDLRQWLGGDR